MKCSSSASEAKNTSQAAFILIHQAIYKSNQNGTISFGDGPSFLPSFLPSPRKHYEAKNESPQFTSICATHQRPLLHINKAHIAINIGNSPKIGPYCIYFLCCQQMSLTTVLAERN